MDSILFSPITLGDMTIENRFVHSACEDNLADNNGLVTPAMLKKYKNLAKGEIGLIISSHLYIHAMGKGNVRQAGIDKDMMVAGLGELVKQVHLYKSKIILQLGHGGLQASSALINASTLGPDNMTEKNLHEVIESFADAAKRASDAGADGVQLHAAHGYLLNEFLSPYYNRRKDAWGGSPKRCFRLIRQIIIRVKKAMPKKMLLLVKLNTNDYTPEPGIDFALAAIYAGWLSEMGVDALELSCGTSKMAPWAMCRGEIPVDELVKGMPDKIKPKARAFLQAKAGQYNLDGPYNLDASRYIKPFAGKTPVFPVGGWRTIKQMEKAMEMGDTDFISMCRPFIREPFLVKKIREGKSQGATCKNCNRCLAALPNKMPVRCYYKTAP